MREREQRLVDKLRQSQHEAKEASTGMVSARQETKSKEQELALAQQSHAVELQNLQERVEQEGRDRMFH